MKQVAQLLVLVRIALLVALAGSAVMVVEYGGAEAFCGAGSGCARVRGHELTRAFVDLFHVSIPEFGLVATLALFVVSLTARSPAAYRFLAALCSAGALIALALIVVQE